MAAGRPRSRTLRSRSELKTHHGRLLRLDHLQHGPHRGDNVRPEDRLLHHARDLLCERSQLGRALAEVGLQVLIGGRVWVARRVGLGAAEQRAQPELVVLAAGLPAPHLVEELLVLPGGREAAP